MAGHNSNQGRRARKYSQLNQQQKSIRRQSWFRIGKRFILQGPEAWRGKRAGRIWDYVMDFIQLWAHYDLFSQAASVVYYLLLAFFPILILLMFFLSLVSRNIAIPPETIEAVKNLLPDPIINIVRPLMHSISPPLSVLSLSVSALTTLWASSKGIGQVFKGISNIYPKKERGISLPARLVGILLTILISIILVLATLIMSFGRVIFDFIEKHFSFLKLDWLLIDLSTYGFGLFLIFVIVYVLYFISSRRSGISIPNWPGAVFAAIAWIALSFIYSFYIARRASFASLYGGLANIIILMLWLNISVQIILYGAIINYQIAWYSAQNKSNYLILSQTIKGLGTSVNPFDALGPENMLK